MIQKLEKYGQILCANLVTTWLVFAGLVTFVNGFLKSHNELKSSNKIIIRDEEIDCLKNNTVKAAVSLKKSSQSFFLKIECVGEH